MIPDEAVEAAAVTIFANVEVIQTRGYAAEIARLALEAALPYLASDARKPQRNSPTDWPDVPRLP